MRMAAPVLFFTEEGKVMTLLLDALVVVTITAVLLANMLRILPTERRRIWCWQRRRGAHHRPTRYRTMQRSAFLRV